MAQESTKSKADHIRDYLKEHPKASSADAAQALSTDDLKINASYVRTIRRKKKSNKKPSKAKKRSKSRGTKSNFGPRPFPASTLEEALQIARAIRD